MKISGHIAFWMLGMFLLAGCRRDMFNQPKSNPLRESDFFPDGAASRPIPPHTVSRDDAQHPDWFYTGMVGTNFVTTFPSPVTRALLERGRERFEINCVPCHGLCGEGDGMVVQRGMPAPSPFSIDRLRSAPVGHFVAVIGQGYGVMYSHASQVTAEDRWAITAYVRALQLSQHATLADVPVNEAAKFKTSP
jgi:hypothetical protein